MFFAQHKYSASTVRFIRSSKPIFLNKLVSVTLSSVYVKYFDFTSILF